MFGRRLCGKAVCGLRRIFYNFSTGTRNYGKAWQGALAAMKCQKKKKKNGETLYKY